MTLLTLQFRITLTDEHRVTIIKIRIQIPNTRTIDTHIISTTQCLRLSQLNTHRYRRYQIIIAHFEIFTCTNNIAYILCRMLKTQAGLESEILIA